MLVSVRVSVFYPQIPSNLQSKDLLQACRHARLLKPPTVSTPKINGNSLGACGSPTKICSKIVMATKAPLTLWHLSAYSELRGGVSFQVKIGLLYFPGVLDPERNSSG